MNFAINTNIIKFLIKIAIIALAAKITALSLYFFLPHFGIDMVKDYSINLYRNYKVAKAFALIPSSSKPKPQPTQPTYKLNNITLKAIYSEGEKGVIAIEDKKKKITILQVGESFNGYKLIKVTPQSAVFEKNHKLYEIKLNEKELKGKYTITQENTSYENLISKQEIDSYKKHFKKIWQNISIDEQYDPKTHKLTGFKVTRINKNSIFGKLGLQVGDLIIGVNNKIFRDLADVYKIYKDIDKYDAIKIMIIRNNQRKDLEYEIY